jgi:phosphatidylserine/phosphatidylglycerophosphate/cardiolipin synthase-like enzyme
MLNFIRQANGPDWALRAAVYEFQQDYVLKVLRDVAASGADVRVIFDARETAGDRGPARRNWEAIRAAGIEDLVIPRTKNPSAISHNKFIILLRDGQPVQVWTGSTNLTDGGIFGHSNCGHVVRDPRVAEQYLRYWEKLSGDPEMSRRLAEDEIRPWNDAEFAVPQNLPPQGCTVLFSPRSNLDALNWYAERMDAARTAVFLTAAFGVNDQFEEVFEREKDYLRYVMLETEDEDMERLNSQPLNCIAIGNVLVENEFERWLAEQLSDLNRHVKYIHTKYMLIDPLGEDPIVITGSANFSDPSTRRNDENMLLIRGDRRVADLYLTEFIRLFNHFQFRMLARAREATGPENSRSFLAPDDSWKTRYYTPGTRQFLERHYFAGP